MKKIIVTLTVFAFFLVKSMGQTPIIDLQDRDGTRLKNAYYKDVNNVLDPFVGTWLYTNGTTSLKIVLVKKSTALIGDYYEDLIIGEYRYVLNGVEKFNSLNNINTIYSNESYHNIYGNHIPTTTSPFDEYFPGEVRLDLYFKDNLGGNINVRKTMVSGLEAIQIFRICYHPSIRDGDPVIDPVGPTRIFTLIKQ